VNTLVYRVQAIVQFFVGIGGVLCGAMMMINPSGTLMQFPAGMLRDSPFGDFFIPGIILFLINGAGQIAAGILTVRRHSLAGLSGAVFGLGLMIWIFVQVNMIGGRNILQYSYFLLGIIETGLSFLIQKNQAASSTKNL
jgi:hypothetical protein